MERIAQMTTLRQHFAIRWDAEIPIYGFFGFLKNSLRLVVIRGTLGVFFHLIIFFVGCPERESNPNQSNLQE